MSDREYASRNLNRDIISQNLEAVNGVDFVEMSLPSLKATFDSNEKTFDRICDLQANILASAIGTPAKFQARAWLQTAEMDYKTIRMRLSERIAQLEQAEKPPAVRSVIDERQPVRVLERPEGLGYFDGLHANWLAFRDLFTALVDSRDYPPLSKLLYLKKACTGTASLALSGYDPLRDCYADAWSALKAIYDDDYAVAQALIDRLLDMPKARNGEVGELRRIIDTTTSTLRQLANLNHDVEHWSALIVNLMTRKLPARLVEQWEQLRKRGENPDLEDLIEFLEGKARQRVFGGETSAFKSTDDSRQEFNRNRRKGDFRCNEGPNKRKVEQPFSRTVKPHLECRYCRQDHWLANCSDLRGKPIADRERILAKLGVCFNCLNFGHLKSHCERRGCSKQVCNGKRHHWLLCPETRPQGNNTHYKQGINRTQ